MEEKKPTHITQEEWNQMSFDHKDQFTLNEQEELIWNGKNKEKNFGKIDADTFEIERKGLTDQFQKLKDHHSKVEQEWNDQEDKLKLRNSLRNLSQSFTSTDFLGDGVDIEAFLSEKNKEIDEIYHQNAAIQLLLVEEAETLKDSENWHKTTEQFKSIIDRWKEGPEVKRNVNESYWKRINDAKDAFFERKRAHYEDVEKEQMVNLDLKIELCEKAEKLADSEDWRPTSEAFYTMMDDWKKIGHLPSQEKNDEMWERFTTARNKFFDKKTAHTEQIKTEQENNYAKKLALVEEMEVLKSETSNWKELTDKIQAMQKQWSEIGRVPEEHNEALWERWKAARDHFFEAKRTHANEFKEHLQANFERKKTITERAEHLSESKDWKNTTNELAELMTEWKTIGPVPRENGDELWERFNKARRHFFKRKDEDRAKRFAQFEQKKGERLKQTEDFLNQLTAEQDDAKAQIQEFTEAIQNISGKGKKDEELKQHLQNLIKNLEKNMPKRSLKIEEVQKQLEELKGEK